MPNLRGRGKLVRTAALTATVVVAGALAARGGGGPENLFLIVNANGPSSMKVANHYVAWRRIPPINVFYVRTDPKGNAIKAENFKRLILAPALQAIERRKLADQIDYIVYSCEFPWFVDFSEMFKTVALPPHQRPVGSLTSATYLYDFVQRDDPRVTALDNNGYFSPSQPGMTLTRGFRGAAGWNAKGQRTATGGTRYRLAASLGYIQPDCSTTPEVLAYLRRSVEADGTRPAGSFYYMTNKDVRSKVREAKFPAAASELRTLGMAARIEPGVVPAGRKDILGLTTGSPVVGPGGSNCKLLPGALVDNLTSAGGQLWPITKPRHQTRVTEYMRLGAAGASGTVVEPFAMAEKFPSPALHVHYARGCSMAEAFYQSVAGPFQLLIVGDPLCQPFAAIPQVTVEGVADGDFVSGVVELTPAAAPNGGRQVSQFELFVDGVRWFAKPAGERVRLDTSKLGDGYHELRIVAIDSSPIEIQGRWIAGVMVKNGTDAVELSVAGGATVAAGEVTLNVASTASADVGVFHNGRELGRAAGGRGTVRIPADKLGQGPVVLEAHTIGKTRVYGRPLRLDVQ